MKMLPVFFAAVVIASCFAGCQVGTPPNNTATPSTTPAAQPSQQVKSEPPAEDRPTNAPVTVPMLNALLNDESFVSAAKSSVRITDQEMERLKAATDEAMNDLDESQSPQRSAKASSEKAKAEVTQILGPERADKFIALVQQKWSGGPANAPNAIPTDTRVVVNAPGFRMDVFDHGKLVKTYKVGIGYPEFPLPTGLRKAKQIIINPPWTPPDEPWVKGKWQPHVKVEPGSKLNPLGVLKIPIGLPNLIHGGKAVGKIGSFASHGCVGLTDQMVEDFAVLISGIAGKSLSLADLKKYEKEKTETKSIDLGDEIPVELRYETIVLENGTLKIFRDVYERGTNTEENVRRVLEVYGTSLDQLDQQTKDAIQAALRAMNTDAGGGPVDEQKGSKKASKTSDKVTRNVKGDKEIDIAIPQLAGKGYPSPVKM